MKTSILNSFFFFISTSFLVLIMSVNRSHAQPFIENADFEFSSCLPVFSFFANGCMNMPGSGGWIAVTGDPRRVVDEACGSATAFFETGQKLENGELIQYGSSLAYSFPNNIAPGNYTLTFRHDAVINGGPHVDLRVDLASGIQGLMSVPGELPNYGDQVTPRPLDNVNSITIIENVAAIDDACDVFSFDFTVPSDQSFNQLWFYGFTINETTGRSKLFLDDVSLTSCTERLECTEAINLNFCSETGNTGYINIDCGIGSTYEVVLPGSNMANVEIDNHQVFITEALPGTYSVTITDANGCIDTRSYEVIEKCCGIDEACQAPQDLGCTNLFGGTYLKWTPVPNVTQYQVCVFPGKCGRPSSNEPLVFCSESSLFNIDQIGTEYFKWTVKAICPDGSLSDALAPICFDRRRCSGFSDGVRVLTPEGERVERSNKQLLDEQTRTSKLGIEDSSFAAPCPDSLDCTECLNLIYCSVEGTTGYIELSCGEQYEYSVNLPSQNSADVFYGADKVIISNASAGGYTVIVSDLGGCTLEHQYTIVDLCCIDDAECPTPQNLGCTNVLGETYLKWDAVPDAVEYQILVFSGDCGGCNLPSTFTSTTNRLNIDLIDAESFEWTVKAVCANGATSDALPRECFDASRCNGFGDGGFAPLVSNEKEHALNSELDTEQLSIYPNPNNGIFDIELADYTASNLQTDLKIFNQSGQVVFQKSVRKSRFSLDLRGMPAGIYVAVMTSANKTLTEKFIVR